MKISKLYVLIILISFSSCSLIGIDYWFELGEHDENGQYVPKRARFKLKDKPNNIIPATLDTLDIYKLVEMYDNGHMVYPTNNYYTDNYSYTRLKDIVVYIKFYSKGRCSSIVVPSRNEDGIEYSLQRKDLNPNNSVNNKNYYYCTDGNKIKIETFVYGQGYGMYIILDYFLNETGDTLKMIHDNSIDVYVREKLPEDWGKYKVDW